MLMRVSSNAMDAPPVVFIVVSPELGSIATLEPGAACFPLLWHAGHSQVTLYSWTGDTAPLDGLA